MISRIKIKIISEKNLIKFTYFTFIHESDIFTRSSSLLLIILYTWLVGILTSTFFNSNYFLKISCSTFLSIDNLIINLKHHMYLYFPIKKCWSCFRFFFFPEKVKFLIIFFTTYESASFIYKTQLKIIKLMIEKQIYLYNFCSK